MTMLSYAENDRSASQDTMGAITADANELGWLSMVGLFLRNAPHNDLELLQMVDYF